MLHQLHNFVKIYKYLLHSQIHVNLYQLSLELLLLNSCQIVIKVFVVKLFVTNDLSFRLTFM